MRTYLQNEGNLSDSGVSRKKLVLALGTNRNTLSGAVKAVTGKTLMKYIRLLQLEEALQMLDQHPELTIEAEEPHTYDKLIFNSFYLVIQLCHIPILNFCNRNECN